MKAFLVFLDESGMLMAPLVRRSWAPIGHTPILYQRSQSHKKVSAMVALCVTPERNRIHLCFRLHPEANINAILVLHFLRNLLKQWKGPVVLLWDRFLAHRAKKVQAFIEKHPRFHAFFFPPFAPELNPVENVWNYLKNNSMANVTPSDLDLLASTARSHGRSLQRKQLFLRSFVKRSPLFLRLR